MPLIISRHLNRLSDYTYHVWQNQLHCVHNAVNQTFTHVDHEQQQKKMHKQVLKDVWWHVPRVKITSPALTAHIKHTAHIEIKRTWTSVCQQHVCRAPISSSWPPAMYASVWLDRRWEREDRVKGCNKGGDTHVHISRTRRELEGRLYMDIIWQVKDTISATKTSSIPFPRTSSLPTILCRVSYGGAMIHRSGSVYQFNDW